MPPSENGPCEQAIEGRGRLAARWLIAGAPALLCAAAVFAVLEVHYSTDTWIALAAGRAIVTTDGFPIADTFSYTFAGTTWFNQNWLSHVFFWLVFEHLGSTALVLVTWLLGVLTVATVVLAVRIRSSSWLAATLAASVVAVACRDWLSIRPATIQFLLLGACLLALSVLVTGVRQWWPVATLAVTLGLWVHAHGSFVFGLALVALWAGCALTPRVLRRPAATDWRRVVAVLAVAIAAVVLGAILGPYGLDNFVHPFKVASSEVFRQIGEWYPPYVRGRYPPVLRFWVVLGLAAASVVIALVLRHSAGADSRADQRPVPLDQRLWDVASVAVGLALALWARRFAPVFYILATPAVVAAVVRWSAGVAPPTARRLRTLILATACCAAVVVTVVTARRAHHDLVSAVPRSRRGDAGLLERVTHLYRTPAHVLRFLGRNRLDANVFTEWKVAGPLLFFAPTSRVYIDGRSQQVYSEEHYLSYRFLLSSPPDRSTEALALLADSGTDLALLPSWGSLVRLTSVLAASKDWIYLFDEPEGVLFVRRASPLLPRLGELERDGRLWWPDLPSATGARGTLLVTTSPPDLAAALPLWTEAIARQPTLGFNLYRSVTSAMLMLGRAEEGLAYIQAERSRVASSTIRFGARDRRRLLRIIDLCEARLRDVVDSAQDSRYDGLTDPEEQT